MRRTPRISCLLFLILLAACAAAQTVCVAAKESGAISDGSLTQTLLSGCLDALFQAGCIATNTAPLAVGEDAWSPAEAELSEAREGYSDYLLSFHVAYAEASGLPGRSEPSLIEYRILRVGDGGLVSEGMLDIPEDRTEKTKERERYLSGLGASLAGAFLAQRGIKK